LRVKSRQQEIMIAPGNYTTNLNFWVS